MAKAKETTEEKLSRGDYVNDGSCPICGKYRKRIDAGKMKPCFMWERIKKEEEDV
jgi:hypothetical protein